MEQVGVILKALELRKIESAGIKSKSLCQLGNKFLKNKLINLSIEELIRTFKRNDIDVVSLIGVMEHLNDPINFIKNFKNQSKIFVFFSTTFSLSVFLKIFYKSIPQTSFRWPYSSFKRISIYIAKNYNLKIIGGGFGTDIPDLYRSLMQSNNVINEKIFSKNLEKHLFSYVDDLQAIVDKKKLSSQVHMVLKKS